MKTTKHYFRQAFYESFFPIFLSLVFLTSIVFFIKISAITSMIKVNFTDLGTIYLFLIPKILLYTLPISFFIALTMSVAKLSRENETLVAFALGVTSKQFSKIFFQIAFIFTIILLVNNIYLKPATTILYKNFLAKKELEAKLNLKATTFGQKFSNWLVFVNKVDKDEYQDIVMFDSTLDEEKLISASSATLQNNNSNINIELSNGKIFRKNSNDFQQINFEKLNINSNDTVSISFRNVSEYFRNILNNKSNLLDAIFHLLMGLFPILSYLLAISLGMINFRYEKGNIYIYMFGFVTLFIVISKNLSASFLYYALLIIPITYILSRIVYKLKVTCKY